MEFDFKIAQTIRCQDSLPEIFWIKIKLKEYLKYNFKTDFSVSKHCQRNRLKHWILMNYKLIRIEKILFSEIFFASK